MTRILKNRFIFLVSIALVLGLGIYFLLPRFLADEIYPLKYQDWIVKYSKQYNVDPALVAAVIFQESRFNPSAVSPVGAQGLMQFMPGTASTMAKEVGMKNYNIFDAETSIIFGAAHLRDLLNKYNGDIDQALASYNAGTGTVDRWVSQNIFNKIINSSSKSETVSYVRKVKNYQTIYGSIYWRELGIENPVQLKKSESEDKNLRIHVWSQVFTNISQIITSATK